MSMPTFRPASNRPGEITPCGSNPLALARSANSPHHAVLPHPLGPLTIEITPAMNCLENNLASGEAGEECNLISSLLSFPIQSLE
jgi:hypothetical protein